jgi:hypothetical protein
MWVIDEPNDERVPVGIITDRDLVVEVMAKPPKREPGVERGRDPDRG